MRTLKISTYLAADLETVKSYLMTPALLNYVVAGLMKFHPIEPNFFPSKWVEGKFSVKMFAFHPHTQSWRVYADVVLKGCGTSSGPHEVCVCF